MAGWLEWVRSPYFKLYCGHTLSSWGDRMWGFAVGLFMIQLVPESLVLTALYGFVRSGSVILFGALIGKWIDGSSRLRAARISIGIQNVAVGVSATILCIFLYSEDHLKSGTQEWLPIVIYLSVIFMACLGELASVATKIIIEKDWIVVITSGDNEMLAKMNSTLRSIDLTTYIVAPILVGQVMTYISPSAAAVFMAGWNLVSMVVELWVMQLIYKQFPDLSRRKGIDNEVPADSPVTCWSAWAMYFQHPICFAGLGLAALYMTVLGFDSVTVGYAYAQGISESISGILTAVGALFGILGSLAFPRIRRRIGVERTGLLGFGMEVACLLLCVASVWAPGSPFDPTGIVANETIPYNATDNVTVSTTSASEQQYTSVGLLMAGIVLARFGLWTADLSVNQVIQEQVEETKRGAISGVQNSINMVMELMKFVLVIALPNWNTFGILVLLSFSCVCLGWFLFALYSRQRRGHLFHFAKLFEYFQPDDVYTMQQNNLLSIRDVSWESCAFDMLQHYSFD